MKVSSSGNGTQTAACAAAATGTTLATPSLAWRQPSHLQCGLHGTYSAPSHLSPELHEDILKLQQRIHKRASFAMVGEPPVDRHAGVRWMSSRQKFQQQYQNVDVPYIDTHCHLDFLFDRSTFKGTFQKFKAENKDTFPECFAGCVAVFCNPKTFIPGGTVHFLFWTKLQETVKAEGAVLPVLSLSLFLSVLTHMLWLFDLLYLQACGKTSCRSRMCGEQWAVTRNVLVTSTGTKMA